MLTGQLLEPHGIIYQPTVRKLKLTGDTFCLIIASDGIWDYMEPDEVFH